MNRINLFGLSCLTASILAGGCNSASDTDLASNTSVNSIVQHLFDSNGEMVNGAKLNGAKLNGAKLNGAKLNGSVTNTMTVTAAAATLIGFIIETGATLRGPNFQPARIPAVADDGQEYWVRVTDYKTMSFPNLPDMDYYMVVNDADGSPICGYDTDGVTPLWALPLTRTFNQTDGKQVITTDEFSFNSYARKNNPSNSLVSDGVRDRADACRSSSRGAPTRG